MRSNLVFFIVLLSFSKSFSQKERIEIKGEITSEVGLVENIHVINKNTNKATISNANGVFQIPVKENDTLLFSAIQFDPKIIIINKNHLENLVLRIILKSKINNLEEAFIVKPNNIAEGLGLPNAGKEPLTKIESHLNYHTKASLPVAILAAILNKKGGIEDIFYIASGTRKKDRRLQKNIDNDLFYRIQEQEIVKLRAHFQNDFFTKTLHIPEPEIVYFIKYCDKKDAIYFFQKKRFLELIDLFIKESPLYLASLALKD